MIDASAGHCPALATLWVGRAPMDRHQVLDRPMPCPDARNRRCVLELSSKGGSPVAKR
jgi:hypothetical protein